MNQPFITNDATVLGMLLVILAFVVKTASSDQEALDKKIMLPKT